MTTLYGLFGLPVLSHRVEKIVCMQWAVVNVETHNWLIYKVKLAECSVVSYQTKTQETS